MIDIPNGAVIAGTPHTRVIQKLEVVGPQAAAFRAFGVPGGSTLLALDNTIGEDQLTLLHSVSVGTHIRLRDSNYPAARAAVYDVIAVSGSGPFVVKVERPIRWQFHAGDAVTILTERPRKIRILGNGMTITGTGDRYIEFQSAIDCYVEYVRLDASEGAATSLWFSWDNGCVNCEAKNVTCIGTGPHSAGILNIETSENCRFVRCSATGATNELASGFAIWDSFGCSLIDCSASGNYMGAVISAVGNTLGSLECTINGGHFDGNASHGINIAGGSCGTLVTGTAADHNRTAGLNVAGTTCATQIRDFRATGNTVALLVGVGAQGTRVNGMDMSGNSVGLASNAPIDIQQIFSCGGNVNGLCVFTTLGPVRMRGFELSFDNLQQIGINALAGTEVSLSDGTLTVGGQSIGVFAEEANVRLHFVRVKETAPGSTAVSCASAATVLVGNGCEFDGCTIPIATGAGGTVTTACTKEPS
jgi:hypothetical protein